MISIIYDKVARGEISPEEASRVIETAREMANCPSWMPVLVHRVLKSVLKYVVRLR